MQVSPRIKQKPIARKSVILLAAMAIGIAAGTNALAAGPGGGGGHGGGGGGGGGGIAAGGGGGGFGGGGGGGHGGGGGFAAGGGGGHGGGGGFAAVGAGGGHVGGGFGGGGHGGGGGFGGGRVSGGFGGGRIGVGSNGGRIGISHLGAPGSAHASSVAGARLHGPRFSGGGDQRFSGSWRDGHHRFHGRHHRFGRFFRGDTFSYFPSYDDDSYADDGGCYRYRHVHTPAGWRWRRVWVCN